MRITGWLVCSSSKRWWCCNLGARGVSKDTVEETVGVLKSKDEYAHIGRTAVRAIMYARYADPPVYQHTYLSIYEDYYIHT